MEPGQWIAAFREAHERFRSGALTDAERARYLAMREELATSLVGAQGLMVPAGQAARRHFRVAQVFAIEINNLYRSMTKDISRAGFSCLVPATLKEGDPFSFALTLKRGEDPVTGQGRVVGVVKQQGNSRVSFSIDTLSEANAERLEMALFDAVLARLK
jgi:PilZ domain